MVSYQFIGQPALRSDGPEKVTGTATYTADVLIPGTLWAKALRSPQHIIFTRHQLVGGGAIVLAWPSHLDTTLIGTPFANQCRAAE